ncbi:MAG: hypothetical protein CL910_17615 [Deltaproteobacteria bacterium]|nr:hypothetical protein [Deltaproteobacteria bacterium]
MPPALPLDRIDTVFLDAGNTLVSIDFDRVAPAIAARGIACTPAGLRRAEARARPQISASIHERGRSEGEDAFAAYLGFVLGHLGVSEGAEALAGALSGELKEPGASDRLWCWVLPGTEAALGRLRALDLDLLVVSNSDGTVEQGLAALGLARFFSGIVDSHRVGSEKPAAGIFEAALERAGAAPERTLHVGDLYHADVLGARACGIHQALLDPWDDWGPIDCPTFADLDALATAFEETRS